MGQDGGWFLLPLHWHSSFHPEMIPNKTLCCVQKHFQSISKMDVTFFWWVDSLVI